MAINFDSPAVREFAKYLGYSLAATAVGHVGARALNVGAGKFSKALSGFNFDAAIKKAVEMSPVLHNAYQTDRPKVESFARTIFKYAPHIATDPNLLSSILGNAIHGQSIDPLTIRALMDMEGRYLENSNPLSSRDTNISIKPLMYPQPKHE